MKTPTILVLNVAFVVAGLAAYHALRSDDAPTETAPAGMADVELRLSAMETRLSAMEERASDPALGVKTGAARPAGGPGSGATCSWRSRLRTPAALRA